MLDPKELRRLMGHFATGVTIITTRSADGVPYGLTANAFTSLSLDPPLCLICVDRKAESFAHFYDSKVFTVNILTTGQEDLSNRFAKSGGDKFTGIATIPSRRAPHLAPVLTAPRGDASFPAPCPFRSTPSARPPRASARTSIARRC